MSLNSTYTNLVRPRRFDDSLILDLMLPLMSWAINLRGRARFEKAEVIEGTALPPSRQLVVEAMQEFSIPRTRSPFTQNPIITLFDRRRGNSPVNIKRDSLEVINCKNDVKDYPTD